MKVSNKFSPLATRSQRQKVTKKKKVSKVSPKKNDVEEPTVPIDAPETVVPKKKPGRPSKRTKKVSFKASDEEPIDAPAAVVAKKKPGRPSTHDEEPIDAPAAVVTKNKPGRPSKKTVTANSANQEPMDAPATVVTKKNLVVQVHILKKLLLKKTIYRKQLLPTFEIPVKKIIRKKHRLF